MKKIALLSVITIWIHNLMLQTSLAQPPSNPDPVPIDGGIGFLIAAAIGLGAGFLYKRNKKK